MLKKKKIILLIISFLLIASTLFAFLFVIVTKTDLMPRDSLAFKLLKPQATVYPSWIDASITQSLKEQQFARVIIQFNSETQKDLSLSSKDFQEKYDWRMYKVGLITKKGLKQLATSTNIKRIVFDGNVQAQATETNTNYVDEETTKYLEENSLTGKGQTICLIDTGIDYTNESLKDNYLGGIDLVNSDDDPLDDVGHGTEMASIIVGSDTLRGIAPNTGLVAVKALNERGSGYVSDVMQGIDFCIQNKQKYDISIINLSLGKDGYDGWCDQDILAEQANWAIAQGITVVASAGDNRQSLITSPACGSSVISVGAINEEAKFIPDANVHPFITTFAPGWNMQAVTLKNEAVTLFGSSIAAAHISGVAALMLEHEPILPQLVRRRIHLTGDILKQDDTIYSLVALKNAFENKRNFDIPVAPTSPGKLVSTEELKTTGLGDTCTAGLCPTGTGCWKDNFSMGACFANTGYTCQDCDVSQYLCTEDTEGFLKWCCAAAGDACAACAAGTRTNVLYHWNIGGEVDATACCENDSGGMYRTCSQTNIAWSCTDDACCDQSVDCVKGSTCYTSPTLQTGLNVFGADNAAVCSGTGAWQDCDDSSLCISSAICYSLNVRESIVCGETFGECTQGVTECCGDDDGVEGSSKEYIRKNGIGSPTSACCKWSDSCVENGLCRLAGTYATSTCYDSCNRYLCSAGSWTSSSCSGTTCSAGSCTTTCSTTCGAAASCNNLTNNAAVCNSNSIQTGFCTSTCSDTGGDSLCEAGGGVNQCSADTWADERATSACAAGGTNGCPSGSRCCAGNGTQGTSCQAYDDDNSSAICATLDSRTWTTVTTGDIETDSNNCTAGVSFCGDGVASNGFCCGDDTSENFVTQGVGAGACCTSSAYCVDSGNVCRTEWSTEVSCADGIDNDCDGLTDAADPNCVSYTPKAQNWQWYDDEWDCDSNASTHDAGQTCASSVNGSALAAENTAPTGINKLNPIKLRLTINETSGLGGTNIKMRVQYAAKVGASCSDGDESFSYVAQQGAVTDPWRYFDGTAGTNDADNTALAANRLTDSGTNKAEHNESGTSSTTFDHTASTAFEWEFTIQNYNGVANTSYCFRAYDNTTGAAIPLNTGETNPELTTASAYDLTITTPASASMPDYQLGSGTDGSNSNQFTDKDITARDRRGTGAGWSLTATSTDWTGATDTIINDDIDWTTDTIKVEYAENPACASGVGVCAGSGTFSGTVTTMDADTDASSPSAPGWGGYVIDAWTLKLRNLDARDTGTYNGTIGFTLL